MKRLRKVEKDTAELKGVAIRTTEILVELSNRTDAGFKLLWSELSTTNQRLDGVTERLDGVTERLDGVTERLDRLIAATLRERTYSADRLADIERRLARLEGHAGF